MQGGRAGSSGHPRSLDCTNWPSLLTAEEAGDTGPEFVNPTGEPNFFCNLFTAMKNLGLPCWPVPCNAWSLSIPHFMFTPQKTLDKVPHFSNPYYSQWPQEIIMTGKLNLSPRTSLWLIYSYNFLTLGTCQSLYEESMSAIPALFLALALCLSEGSYSKGSRIFDSMLTARKFKVAETKSMVVPTLSTNSFRVWPSLKKEATLWEWECECMKIVPSLTLSFSMALAIV